MTTPAFISRAPRVFCIQCDGWKETSSPINTISGKTFCSFGCYDLYFSAAERAKRKKIADVLAGSAIETGVSQ